MNMKITQSLFKKKNEPLTFNIHHGRDIYNMYRTFGEIKLNLAIQESIIMAIDFTDMFCEKFY